MAPPPAGPLIQGSTTPMAKETATAASTASPPASSTLAPTSAARRCAAATTPPRVGITTLRMIWVREKLSMARAVDFKSLQQVRQHRARRFGRFRESLRRSVPAQVPYDQLV